MGTSTRNFILTASSALAILFFCPALQGNSLITLTGNTNWSYQNINVGPYLATLDGAPNVLVYCLDAHIDTNVGPTYSGYLSHPSGEAEEEAAFLAAYSLTVGAPSSDPRIIASLEGPLSMAIWQLMGTLSPTDSDPLAKYYVDMAKSAYDNHQITPAFLSSMIIWNPDPAWSEQRFITAATPEPGTVVFMATGVLLIALSRIRRRR